MTITLVGPGTFDPVTGRLPRALLQASRAMRLRTDKVLADCGLTESQFEVLQILDRLGEMSSVEISRVAKVSRSVMSPRLELLDHAGYVTRTTELGTGHRYRVEITSAGRDVLRSAQRRITFLERSIRNALGPQATSSLVEDLFALGNALSTMG